MISGVLWTYLVALALGPWVGAFSFPVLSCWVAGGASGIIAAAGTCTKLKRGYVLAELLLVTAIITAATIGTEPLFILLSRDQRLELVFVLWKPSSDPLSVEKQYGLGITSEELTQLKLIGVTGQLTVMGPGTFGRGKHTRAVILMQHESESPVELAQPDGSEVIYLQYDNEWKMYPPNAPTLRRTIRLEPDKRNPGATLYMVELADGSAQGGTAFTW